jgi:hypothetical protein
VVGACVPAVSGDEEEVVEVQPTRKTRWWQSCAQALPGTAATKVFDGDLRVMTYIETHWAIKIEEGFRRCTRTWRTQRCQKLGERTYGDVGIIENLGLKPSDGSSSDAANRDNLLHHHVLG